MDMVKGLSEYGKNQLVILMEGLLIDIMGKERYEYLLENRGDKGNVRVENLSFSLSLPSYFLYYLYKKI
jgi:hypothetical protein